MRETSAGALTVTAYISFLPIGIATVLLGPMLPLMSSRWSLNYSQAGALFTAQYVSSTCAVPLSGFLASRFGYLFPIKIGLLLMAAGLALLLNGPKLMGILCIAAYGGGLGLSVPAANLLVAAVNPSRRGETLNWLNFFWSMGAVACPFLVAFSIRLHAIPIFLRSIASISVAIAVWIVVKSARTFSPPESAESRTAALFPWRKKVFVALAALFLAYVGTENSFGGWVATYARSLTKLQPSLSLATPSFFYFSLTIGRWLAPQLLRRMEEIKLAQSGLLLACIGMTGLIFSSSLAGVIASACLAGLGLSSVYPITIALLSKSFGSASTRVGSVMFVLSNVGGGLLPWLVGLSSSRFGTLKVGLFVPLIGCLTMYFLYLTDWGKSPPQRTT